MTFDELSARYRQLESDLEQLAAEAERAALERDVAAQEREVAAQERDRASHERDRASDERDRVNKALGKRLSRARRVQEAHDLVSLELERTRRHLFGKKAETVDPSQTQLAFLLATASEKLAQPRDSGSGEKQRGERGKPAPHGRGKVPEHLPTERIELVPAEVRVIQTRGNASARKRAS